MKVGFIGLGGMGKYMALNVLEAKFELTVYDIRETPVREFEALGAKSAPSPKEVAETSGLVLSSLPSVGASETVALSENGVLAGAKKGDIYIDMSTLTPSVIQRIAKAGQKKGIEVLDGPVSGSVAQRKDGKLSIMIGGSESAIETARPVLNTIGSNIFHVGDVGAGNAAKLANNLIALTSMVTIMEGLVLGVKAGVDPEKLCDVIRVSSGGGPLFANLSNAILKRRFEPPEGQVAAQSLRNIPKDLQLALDLAGELSIPLPVTSVALQTWIAGRAKGLDEKEFPALITLFEDMVGVEIKPKA
jgi:2-hydroxymethylglutarate dehydrogenase